MKSPAFLIDRSTCVSAAKWTTMSDACTSGAAAAASATSPLTKRWRGWSFTLSRFSSRPAYVSLSSVVTRQSSCAARAYRTKLDPMKPAPPVTRTLTICSGPIVRQRAVGVQAVLVRIGVPVGLRRHVDDQRHVRADAFPPVVHEVGHLHERRVLAAEEEFVDGAVGRRVRTRVDQHELDHPRDAREVVDLFLVIVPRLHDARVRRGDIDLSELREQLLVAAEDFHEPAALVGHDAERFGADAVNRRLGGERELRGSCHRVHLTARGAGGDVTNGYRLRSCRRA